MSVPFFFRTSLLTNLYRVLVFLVVAKESVDAEFVLKTHWKSLSLVWEVNKYIFLGCFCDLYKISLKLLWLGLFDALWDDDLTLLEFLLLHVHGVVLKLDDT